MEWYLGIGAVVGLALAAKAAEKAGDPMAAFVALMAGMCFWPIGLGLLIWIAYGRSRNERSRDPDPPSQDASGPA